MLLKGVTASECFRKDGRLEPVGLLVLDDAVAEHEPGQDAACLDGVALIAEVKLSGFGGGAQQRDHQHGERDEQEQDVESPCRVLPGVLQMVAALA